MLRVVWKIEPSERTECACDFGTELKMVPMGVVQDVDEREIHFGARRKDWKIEQDETQWQCRQQWRPWRASQYPGKLPCIRGNPAHHNGTVWKPTDAFRSVMSDRPI